MGMDMGIVCLVKACLCINEVLSGTASVVQWLSSKGTIWKSSSSSSSMCTWASRVALEAVRASSSEISLSLEELYVSCLHTGMR